jgi:hypothetical protein
MRFEEFFPLVLWYRTVDYMVGGFCFVGHSDFLFIIQIWLRGPMEKYTDRLPGWWGTTSELIAGLGTRDLERGSATAATLSSGLLLAIL